MCLSQELRIERAFPRTADTSSGPPPAPAQAKWGGPAPERHQEEALTPAAASHVGEGQTPAADSQWMRARLQFLKAIRILL